MINPNPDIEMRLIVQVIDMPKKVIKTVTTSLVIGLFMNFLGILRTCASFIFSISGLGIKIFTLIICLGFTFSIGAQTKIYKYTDKNGNIHFTDKNPSYGEKQKSDLKFIAEIPVKQLDSAPNRRRESHKEKQAKNIFENFVIATPENKVTLYGTKGNVVASVNVEGDIQTNYRIKFYVDDLPHGKVKSKSQLIADVEIGEHSIYAEMIDDSTRRVILTTPKTIFYLKDSPIK